VTRNLDMTPDGRFVAYIAKRAGNSGTNTCVNVWDAQNGTKLSGEHRPERFRAINRRLRFAHARFVGRFVAFTCTAA